jgi:hypothetical protein
MGQGNFSRLHEQLMVEYAKKIGDTPGRNSSIFYQRTAKIGGIGK